MRPLPNPAPVLRAVPRAAPGQIARSVGRPARAGSDPQLSAPALSACPQVPLPRDRAVRVLAAGLALSAFGHAAVALWLVQTPALPPPDGPDVPATEVSLLSGAQFAALTAPQPDLPVKIAPALQPLPDDADPMALPRDLAAATSALQPAAMAPPSSEEPPDIAALTVLPPEPQVVVLMPELTVPQPSPTGVPVPRPAADPVAQTTPPPPDIPDRTDTRPVAPEAAPVLPEPAAKPPAAAPKAERKPASLAGDGGVAETTRAKSAGSAEARDGWLAAIRARVERRKAYPAAAGGAEGRVTLQLTVDRAGRLKSVGVARSSGNPTLDAAALRAVKSAGRFPKAPGGVTEAAVTFNLPLRFSAGT